jgi:hypothetical protein
LWSRRRRGSRGLDVPANCTLALEQPKRGGRNLDPVVPLEQRLQGKNFPSG